MADLYLVDNDARLLELYTLFLTKRGHSVRSSTSFHEARAQIREHAPELLLSDLELGAERGDEELARLALSGELPPTLVVSGYLDRQLEAKLARLPCVVGTLAKPFDLATLEARIAESLERARARVS
ncbi:MAG: response regulator [Planctomycetes bacterium]|nr:response regulator [Planctomycetota bacterium]